MRDKPVLRDKKESLWRSLGDVTTAGVTFKNPILTASGTAGHGAELAPYFALSSLGAVVVKSLYPTPWPGNPAPRVHNTPSGMINAVGLQGPGIDAWIQHDLPALRAVDATVVASIWGRTVDDYAKAADQLVSSLSALAAIEVNLSCPNIEGRSAIFAHDAELSAQVMRVVVERLGPHGVAIWAKLSPNTDRILHVVESVEKAGATAVTLINTLLGMQLDISTRRATLGNGGGGLSGRAIHPVAVRTIFDVRHAFAGLPIIGVGGVSNGSDVIEMMMAGASLVQIGTATFADPRAPQKILHEASRLMGTLGATKWGDVLNAAH
ncbi:MAG: dihydroorotate dehydrogenase [Ilumatobacteraceae bacterium]|nr:dihydroorotate dehydrogenase [Ilumatobacteraceae bacterium]